jgi:hypothetical protein
VRNRNLTAEFVREQFSYDPDTGVFVRIKSAKPACVGRIMGAHDRKGYLRFNVDGACHLAHRVAWLHYHGYWPRQQIDHINHVRDDNRIANLRECTNAENRQNIRPEGYGVSGYLGVSPAYDGYGWIANITVNQKLTYLGLFETPEEASKAYLAAKQKIHTFASTGVSELGATGV